MNLGEMNLLVVEDDAFQRRLIVSMLHSLGATRIQEAENGKQAIDRVRDPQLQSIDLVLCDLNMPEMDGLELLRLLGKEDTQPITVIVSALDEKLLSSANLMAKMYGVRLQGALPKPLTRHSLSELLTQPIKGDKKWQPQQAAHTFALEEILQGIKDDQFEPYFQAKVDIKSGRLVGAEALARWVHPQLGIVAPYAFIPLLEQSGQIDELTFAILRKSAQACRAFHDQGHILTISVNLSLNSLNEVSLAERIIATTQQAGIDPHYIVLEITESAAMTETGAAMENLTRLGMHGFLLSIDDYGTGYSSMQQLTRIAFGELKIDQSFVKDAALHDSLRIVVQSSIEMAHKLQVKSVAEGVETQSDWDMLHAIGCDTAQGYFISRPLERSAFTHFMSSYARPVTTLTEASARPRGELKLLVVDDDDFSRRIVVRILGDLGFNQVIAADSATAALNLLEIHDFDLIITDVDMPDMTGLEMVHLIRSGKTAARADTRIMVLTSYSNSEVLGVGLALDVNGFLVKPVIPAVLDEKINQALTENLKLRPPLAYQAVNTGKHEPAAVNASILKSTAVQDQLLLIPMLELRPGMIVHERICTKDGTLLLKAGQVLSELAINRIRDLSEFIPQDRFAVEVTPVNCH